MAFVDTLNAYSKLPDEVCIETFSETVFYIIVYNSHKKSGTKILKIHVEK
jgi:hypothetical protein